jgi:tartrate-resistant acid phosphatase type 5
VPDRRGRRGVLLVGLVGLAALVAAGVWIRRREPAQPAPPPGWRPRAEEIADARCAAVEPPSVDAGVGRVRFAAIGDFGYAGPTEEAVADLVKGFRPDFIITLGDNNYPLGSAETIDLNIGLFYHEYIAPYRGRFGCGALHNHFFPALGNHDWMTAGARPYLDYFELPGNERYYEVMSGPVQLFALDSDPSEPDGITADSAQAAWLHQALAVSTAAWKIVYLHHAPYSSGPHGGTTALRWPYKAWGADLVLAGHDHTYERFEIDGLPYVVNGLGGAVFYPMGRPVAGSVARFNDSAGALFVEADDSTLRARFQTADGRKIDELSLAKVPR